MKAILLDLDGTLTDPAEGIVRCFHHTARAFERDASGDLTRFIGPPMREAIAELLETRDPETIERGVAVYRERFSTVGLFENAVYPGIVEVLTALCDAGLQLRVATSKAKVYADRIVDHFGLRRFIPTVYGAELGGALSDKPELLAYALRMEGWQPEAVCMVGDRAHDVRGARANGVASVGVLWGFGSAEELRHAGADLVVEQVPDLPHAIASLSQSLPESLPRR